MKVARTLLTSLFFALLALPHLVFAQQFGDLQNYLGSWFSVENLVKFLFPNFPDEWLRIPQVILYVVVPFITAFTVLYGLLIELRIFRNQPKVNTVLAFAMAFLLMPSGILTWIVTIFYAGGAFIGVMGFIVVFIIGVFIWGYGTTWRFWGTYGSAKSMARDIHDLNNQILHVQNQIRDLQALKRQPGVTADQAAVIDQHIAKLQDRLANLQAQRGDIHQRLQGI